MALSEHQCRISRKSAVGIMLKTWTKPEDGGPPGPFELVMRAAFVQALCELAELDPRVWLLTADLGWSVVEPFQQRFPGRFINVGVAEQNLHGIAAGLAREEQVPFIYSIATFASMRGYEQFRNG